MQNPWLCSHHGVWARGIAAGWAANNPKGKSGYVMAGWLAGRKGTVCSDQRQGGRDASPTPHTRRERTRDETKRTDGPWFERFVRPCGMSRLPLLQVTTQGPFVSFSFFPFLLCHLPGRELSCRLTAGDGRHPFTFVRPPRQTASLHAAVSRVVWRRAASGYRAY